MGSTGGGERLLWVVRRRKGGHSRGSSPVEDTSSGSDERDVSPGENSSRG